jgi:two-component system sensor histidine kinase KdpD
MSGPRYPLGVVGVRLRREHRLSIDQETLLQNFLSQVASAFEREFLNDLTKQSISFMESERLYKTLFDSVSHELRTPIATILSGSEQLLALDRSHHGPVIQEMHTAGERLNRLVENLLDMTRLESGMIRPRPDWCDIRDLVNGATRKSARELQDHVIVSDVPNDLPLIRADSGLLEQALVNLLINAALYTPAGSTIRISVRLETSLVISVEDNGPGFPKEALAHLFDKFYRVPGSRTGGTGLGLSIARGFIEAQRGTLSAANGAEGGARLVITLPYEQTADDPDRR